MRQWRWYSKVLLALAVLAFAYFVWPTPWSYQSMGPLLIRTNRLTNRTQMFYPTEGWSRVPRTTKLDPEFKALAEKSAFDKLDALTETKEESGRTWGDLYSDH